MSNVVSFPFYQTSKSTRYFRKIGEFHMKSSHLEGQKSTFEADIYSRFENNIYFPKARFAETEKYEAKKKYSPMKKYRVTNDIPRSIC